MIRASLLLFLAVAAATIGSFLPGDLSTFQSPSLARILIFHLPCALLTPTYLFLAAYLAVRHLATRQPHWDARLCAANELAFLFGLLTMATGIVFSRVQWGITMRWYEFDAWWQRDPRQTSFLFVLLILAAGFALRAGQEDARKKAAASAAYALIALVPVVFLIFVYPRLPTAGGLHPNDTLAQRQLRADYWYALLGALAALGWLSAILYRLRIRAGLLEEQLENLHGRVEILGGGTAPTGVVRPVSVSSDP